MDKADVDPDLERQLDAAGADEPVEAVLVLHADSPQQPSIDAEALMRRVCPLEGEAEMQYMPRLGTLVVRARSRVIRALIIQPEVEGACANRAREL
jgi:hypothetical protein